MNESYPSIYAYIAKEGEKRARYLENEKIVSKDTEFFYIKKDDFELNKINRNKKS